MVSNIYKYVLLLLLLVVMLTGNSNAQTAEPPPNFTIANGTSSEPFFIETWQNLYWLSQNPSEWNKHFNQIADIEFPTSGSDAIANWDGGAGWLPVGTNSNPFTGTYDGENYEIRNLYINRPSNDRVGLFSTVEATPGSPAVIRRVGLVDHSVTGRNNVGGLVGYLNGVWNAPAIVEESFTHGFVKGNNAVGGVVGYTAFQGRIENVYSRGIVEITDWQQGGGITGANFASGNDAVINKVFSTVEIIALGTQTGGIVGAGSGSVQNSFWDTQVSGLSTSAGGTGKSTADMKDITTFTDTNTTGLDDEWDFFGIWEIDPSGVINDGYPFLQGGGFVGGATTFYSRNGGGDWDDTTIWSIDDCSEAVQAPAGEIPVSGSNAIICPGDNVELESTFLSTGIITINVGGTLTIDSSGSLTSSNTIENGGTLTINGSLTSSGFFTNSGDLTIAGIFTANGNVTNSGNTIISGVTTYSGTLTHVGSPIMVESDGLFNNTTTSSPQLILRREMKGFDGSSPQAGEGWRYLSSPVATNLSDLLGNIWTQGLTDNPSSGNSSSGTPNVYRWNTDTEGNNRGDWEAIRDLEIPISAGDGFLVYVYAADFGDTNTGENPVLEIFGEEFGGFTIVTNENEGSDGWSLIGNPFATSISFEQLRDGATSGSIADAVYVWTPIDTDGDGGQDPDAPAINPTGSWKAWSSGGIAGFGDLTDGLISPFQAFFVENSAGSSNVELTFDNSVKSSDFPEFLFKTHPESFIRIELTGESMRNSAWLTFNDNGSIENRVSGDAWQLQPLSTDYALIATKKEAGLMDIGNFPYGNKLTIPVIAEVTRSGAYQITVTDCELYGKELFLNDHERGESIRIESGVSYNFDLQHTAKPPSNPFSVISNGLMKASPQNAVRFTISSDKLYRYDDELPGDIKLSQNYPNPFNPTTQIRYELPQQANVRLTVYDITGRQVATLVNETVQAGVHTVTFDAGSLSSGVYIYRLQAGNVLLSRKLTVIK